MLLAANSAKSEGCPWILGEILPHFRFLSSSHCTEKNKLESDNKTSTCNKISNAVGQNSNAVAQIPSRAPLIRSHLIRSRHIWSGKDTLDPVKTYLIRSYLIRSHLIRHIWSDNDTHDPVNTRHIWSGRIWSGHIWSGIFDPITTYLIRHIWSCNEALDP